MHMRWTRPQRPLAALALACVTAAAHAANPAEQALRDAHREFVTSLGAALIPASLGTNPANEQRVSRLRKDLEQKLDQLGNRWIAEELAAPKKAPDDRTKHLPRRMMARAIEAFALASGDLPTASKLDHVRTLARQDPVVMCRDPLAPVLDAAPEPTLEALEAMLQHLGRPGQSVPAVVSPTATERALTAGMMAVTYPGSTPIKLNPDLERYLKATSTGGSADEDAKRSCELMIWWAGTVLLKAPAERDEDAKAFLQQAMFEQAVTLEPRLASLQVDAMAVAPDGYPLVASFYGITGTTKLDVEVTDDGVPVAAKVVARTVLVPGLPGEHSAAFEQVFDVPAITNALGRTYDARKHEEPRGKLHARTITFSWKLN